jgi:hypothetical protein
MAIIPQDREAPSGERVAKAVDFLANDWLCDVATDVAGKCVLIALALTILERVLLPERPAYFVTAGKRGGGKTTAVMMVVLAVTGKKPPAAAWSTNDEERRKAILSYLAEGLAVLVWDNISLGTTISCKTLEAVLTAESYSDRILGQTANLTVPAFTVPAFTVMAFTGNNIGPKGDMASRSLVARLDVDRPDPENRSFKHAEPVAWTLENRGKILCALYVLLTGIPQLRAPKAAKTRFKVWWHLVGSAVENAAERLVDRDEHKPQEEHKASKIDFGKILKDVEGEDEETTSLADILDVLYTNWTNKYFEASDVLRTITAPYKGEEDTARKLREYFDPTSGKGETTISPIKLGKRLGTMVDAPAWTGERNL